MSNSMEMLGKVVQRLVLLVDSDEDNLLGVIFDLLGKTTKDSTHNPWPDELKRFARMEPCWEDRSDSKMKPWEETFS